MDCDIMEFNKSTKNGQLENEIYGYIQFFVDSNMPLYAFSIDTEYIMDPDSSKVMTRAMKKTLLKKFTTALFNDEDEASLRFDHDNIKIEISIKEDQYVSFIISGLGIESDFNVINCEQLYTVFKDISNIYL
jgi:hypothetical protein